MLIGIIMFAIAIPFVMIYIGKMEYNYTPKETAEEIKREFSEDYNKYSKKAKYIKWNVMHRNDDVIYAKNKAK